MVVKEDAGSRNLRETNLKSIFNYIGGKKRIFRAELARITNLSRATVSALVDELIRDELIVSRGVGESETTGRKPIMLEVNALKGQIATISLQQNGFVYSLYDFCLNELESMRFDIEYSRGFAGEMLLKIRDNAKMIDWGRVFGLCVTVPATILTDTRQILSTVLSIEPGYAFLEELVKLLPGIPVFAANSSSMLAYAELEFGDAAEVQNLIYINIMEGVGAGIIMDGKLFKGAYGRAGEFGHMSIDLNGPECACGKRGCIERMLNKAAIIDEFEKAAKNPESSMSALAGSLDYPAIRKALEHEDHSAFVAAMRVVEKLAQAVSNLVCMFNPELIVLGGGVQELGDVFFSLLKSSVASLASKGTMWTRRLSLIYTCLSQNPENLGIAKYFLDQVYTISTRLQGKLYL